jgi:hypothetical protein
VWLSVRIVGEVVYEQQSLTGNQARARDSMPGRQVSRTGAGEGEAPGAKLLGCLNPTNIPAAKSAVDVLVVWMPDHRRPSAQLWQALTESNANWLLARSVLSVWESKLPMTVVSGALLRFILESRFGE